MLHTPATGVFHQYGYPTETPRVNPLIYIYLMTSKFEPGTGPYMQLSAPWYVPAVCLLQGIIFLPALGRLKSLMAACQRIAKPLSPNDVEVGVHTLSVPAEMEDC